ncbi:hypothetical protein LNKW23_28170 [Paralimibaculum aggregatum]|uniref:VPLPA-CTERM sorting domain-containing protein n=1 Tax=Paralimibaculum aggregatum TaxID=3036245 RepID=A0ABQ6LMS6_9RHOB|nr:VPLPA-CTERM sorting domain-containing protein [Limibaculum sp. NKW23]GMG83604.1 hypothetical protein LNKW23_28170 [Limibaculum sp. NKW23]
MGQFDLKKNAIRWGAAAALTCLPMTASGAVIGESFDFSGEILGLDISVLPVIGLPLPSLDIDATVGVGGSGTATAGVDDPADAEFAFVAVSAPLLGFPLAEVSLGVIGVDWIDADSFDLVFDLTTTVSALGLDIASVSVTAVETINWTISNIGDGTMPIESIVFNGAASSALLTGTSPDTLEITDGGFGLDIAYNNLIAAGVGIDIFDQPQPVRARFDITTGTLDSDVPLPAAFWMMLAGVGGLGALRARRRAAA